MELKLKKLKYRHNDIRNILVQLYNIYMSQFLRIKRDKDFNKDILPKMNALAEEQGKTRSDVIRDILYAKFNYEPITRSQDQINKDHIKKRQKENEQKHRYIAFRVDNAYLEMFYLNMVAYSGNLGKNCNAFFNQALYEYFGLELPEIYSTKFDKPIIKPQYHRIKIANLFEGNNIDPELN